LYFQDTILTVMSRDKMLTGSHDIEDSNLDCSYSAFHLSLGSAN